MNIPAPRPAPAPPTEEEPSALRPNESATFLSISILEEPLSRTNQRGRESSTCACNSTSLSACSNLTAAACPLENIKDVGFGSEHETESRNAAASTPPMILN